MNCSQNVSNLYFLFFFNYLKASFFSDFFWLEERIKNWYEDIKSLLRWNETVTKAYETFIISKNTIMNGLCIKILNTIHIFIGKF